MTCGKCGADTEHRVTRGSPTNANPKGLVVDVVVHKGRGVYCYPDEIPFNGTVAEEI